MTAPISESTNAASACPFCGGPAKIDACDRLITIGCEACGFNRAFSGLLQTKESPVRVSDSEFYHKHAKSEAIAAWNVRAALSKAEAAAGRTQPERLIGWRTPDYLEETADPAMAKNWSVHHELLPIFEGDPYTNLAAQPSPVAVEPTVWQSIETAPKDGRTLLLGYYNSHGNWRTLRGRWMSEDYIAEYWEEPEGVEPGWFETSVEADEPPNCWRTDPSHWQPLPTAPKEIQSDQ